MFLRKPKEDINLLYAPTVQVKNCANYINLGSSGSKKFLIISEIPTIELEGENFAEDLKKLDQ